MPASRGSTPSTGRPVASMAAATSAACRGGAGLVQDHAGDPDVRVEGGQAVHDRRRRSGTTCGDVDAPGRPGRGSASATCAVEAKPSPPIRPSNRPITPSMTATSAASGRRAVQQQRHELVLADQVRVEVAAGPAGGQRVVAGVDVVRADLVPADLEARRRAARPSARWRPWSCRARRRARRSPAGAARHHSMPRWPFWPGVHRVLDLGHLGDQVGRPRSACGSARGR